ncbi:MAG: DUF1223 domain-containing protein [Bryobacteraceae bacterium]
MSRFKDIAPLAFAGALLCGATDLPLQRTPVLLELFTSEGCSSCPPADQVLQAFDRKQPIEGVDLIVLSEHVDYWDRLGWKDPFSSAQYTARQREYTEKYNLDGVYTPQLVVDGHFGVVGSDTRAASSAIQRAKKDRKIPIAISNAVRDGNRITAHVEIPAGEPGNRNSTPVLFVAIADDRAETQVSRGENAGRTLGHVAVTRILTKVGSVDSATAYSKDLVLSIPASARQTGSRVIVFLQDPKSGRILGVAAQKL